MWVAGNCTTQSGSRGIETRTLWVTSGRRSCLRSRGQLKRQRERNAFGPPRQAVTPQGTIRRHCRPRRPSEGDVRSEEHTSELQSRYVISYAVFCLKKK